MIDSHFHLHHIKSDLYTPKELATELFKDGLYGAIDIGISAIDFKDRMHTASCIPNLYTAHGLYPSECSNENLINQMEYLESILQQDNKTVAIGEIGLDLFHDYGALEKQKDLFIKQIKLADKLNLPIIVHSRNAEKETLEVLKNHTPKKGGIIHCFSYSEQTAFEFIELGFFISFAGNLTYKNSKSIQTAAKAIPSDRLLLETDSPYLSPNQVRREQNYPGYIGYTYEFLSILREKPLEELIDIIKTNFKLFINQQPNTQGI